MAMNRADDFPPLAEILPQTGRMALLDRILAHDPEHTVCAVDVDQSRLFQGPDGCVPVWVGIEYMAQCIAAHGGLLARGRNEDPKPGLFLGSRRLTFRSRGFEPGSRLEVSARHRAGEPGRPGLLVFRCALRDPQQAQPLAEGQLNVYGLESLDALFQGAPPR